MGGEPQPLASVDWARLWDRPKIPGPPQLVLVTLGSSLLCNHGEERAREHWNSELSIASGRKPARSLLPPARSLLPTAHRFFLPRSTGHYPDLFFSVLSAACLFTVLGVLVFTVAGTVTVHTVSIRTQAYGESDFLVQDEEVEI